LTRLLPYVAKLNVRAAPDANEADRVEQLAALVEAAKAAGCAVQWDVCSAAISLVSMEDSEGGGTSTPPLPLGEGRGEGSALDGLVNTALTLARLCRAHTFEGYLIALEGAPTIPAYRLVAARLAAAGFDTPLTLKTPRLSADDTLLRASLTLGSLLCDGVGDAIEVVSDLPSRDALRLSYNILQGARRRISKTEFISCPSCGRTQFDLETTTQRIKSQTSHLTGVKIAIMGCIVNGPGEMADADFGYVGAGPDQINLYVGKECVERHISFDLADQKLIELIKAHGKWIDPA
jgi:1-hydroxy-2-methyl-2-(E)-butenyl 4-diphosphate synthase